MCECLSNADGSRHLCAACAPEYDEFLAWKVGCGATGSTEPDEQQPCGECVNCLTGQLMDSGHEIETLRARCSRLRAALAGVVGSYDDRVVAYVQRTPSGSTHDLGSSREELLAALEVLRETAEEGKT